MIKRWPVGGALLSLLAASAGCDSFLGLDDKPFETTTITLTGGTGGATSTAGAGGGTGGSGGVGGGGGSGMGGTVAGGSGGGIGGTGGELACLAGAELDRVTDELDFPLCPGDPDAATTLKKRGFHLGWQDEMYPLPNIGLSVGQGKMRLSVMESVYWFNGEVGPSIVKPITGDFLIVADVSLSKSIDSTLPACSQAGAGILVRDPASAKDPLERWISVDRGSNGGAERVHGTWSNGAGMASQESVIAPGEATGKVALCRKGGVFHAYTKTGNTWIIQDALIAGYPTMPDEVQAGMFLYAYDDPKISIPAGVTGTFDLIHQHDIVNDSCDPAIYFE